MAPAGSVRARPVAAVTGPADPLAAPGTRGAAPSIANTYQPSLNFYGVSGLIDMPTGEAQPDGELNIGVSWFGGVGRFSATFQALPWLSTSFRYNGIQNANIAGFETYYDRSFDVRFRLAEEGRYRPAIQLGLQDFVGTGIFSAEYLSATKTFRLPASALGSYGTLKLTGGLGWGRLGTYGSIGSLGNRPAFDVNSTGGQVAFNQWFRGPVAPFGGIEWRPNDKLGIKLEYSSDIYEVEAGSSRVFERRSPINFGIEYQVNPSLRVGGYYLYGSEIGVNLQVRANPRAPTTPLTLPAPQPVAVRQDPKANPEAWTTDWAASREVPPLLRDQLIALLDPQGVSVVALTVRAHEAELRYRNRRYFAEPNATGRAARAMAQVLPPSVETFHLVPMASGLGASRITLRRSDLEVLEYEPDATAALSAVIGYSDAPKESPGAARNGDLYPKVSVAVQPYFEPSYFDPDLPIRLDVGAELRGVYTPAPGWTLAGSLRYRLAGNLEGGRPSNSVLQHVRSDWVRYVQNDLTLRDLFVSRQWQPRPALYARVSAGYLEQMFGGVSAELLWKPVSSPLGIGIEANYVAQRDTDGRFGFGEYDYRVATGHVSTYYEFGPGLVAQVDAGRYLAGDWGATFGLDRVFDNGWSLGAFFTLTNVSAEDFGEGSFDKGIRFSMPLNWILAEPSRQTVGTTITPITRDGGQRLRVPGRLYPQIRHAHRRALEDQLVRFWQ